MGRRSIGQAEDDFYLNVALALSGCQSVELELKLYITEAFQLVQKCLEGKMPFRMAGQDYAESSLEGLIKVFKKLNDNKALVARLEKFKDERNFLTHRAITHCLDHEGGLFFSAALDLEHRLEAIKIEAGNLRTALHQEANKFRFHLWFDDLSDERNPD